MLPLAFEQKNAILLPAIYGIATGIPVLIFACLIAFGANKIAKTYDKIVSFERWARKITGVIFIVVGVYYSINNILV
ncbi:MAG: hypothetical protein WCJ49_03890 [Deltaproteobacteria bacterium]